MDLEPNNDHFLLFDRIAQISQLFTKNGWITVYESGTSSEVDRALVYCGLLRVEQLDNYLKTNEWKINLGSEGKPSILSAGFGPDEVEVYYSSNPHGLEPMIFHKAFSHVNGHETYVDIGEEFVLYFNLYEQSADKQNRKYFYIDDGGELEEVIIVEPKTVKIKLRYLKEYLAIRKLYLSICFDFERIQILDQTGKAIAERNAKNVSESLNYNHLVRAVPGSETKIQSSVHGKVIVKYDESKRVISHFNRAYEFENFKIGYDDNGDEISVPCNDEWFGDKYVFFKKEVLDKYHNDPGRYTVGRFSVESDFFRITIDNDLINKIAVRMRDLMLLPHREQLYWKSFNIISEENLSRSFFETMYEGDWDAMVQSPDMHFKEIYLEFNDKWAEKYGSHLFRALGNENMHHFTSLHLPTTNNKKAFLSQMLSLVIVTIDSLNENLLPKDPVRLDQSGARIKWGSIDALNAFLENNQVDDEGIIEFLRELQKLRSKTGAAHRVSTSDNKAVTSIKKYFGITENNYVEVAREVFTKMIWVLNFLKISFLKSTDIPHPKFDT